MAAKTRIKKGDLVQVITGKKQSRDFSAFQRLVADGFKTLFVCFDIGDGKSFHRRKARTFAG